MSKVLRSASLAAGWALLLTQAAWSQVQVERPWARPTVTGQKAGGGFVSLQSAQADRLLGASTPAAGRVELHRMQMEGDVMRMREVGSIDLPAKTAVRLEPGGLHLMFMELKAPLKEGDEVPLTLKFEKAGDVQVRLKVSATPPMP